MIISDLLLCESANPAFEDTFGATMPGGMDTDAGTTSATGSDFEVSSSDYLPF